MIIDILSIFPEMFSPTLKESILKKAQQKKLIEINVHNLRNWTTDKHQITDDRPFGGGPGMVMKPEPIFRAVKELKKNNQLHSTTILLTPKGKIFNQQTAAQLSEKQHLILICGRYEGTDQRVHDHLVDQKISIGKYILTGGELPAMVITDAVTRLIPGVLGNPDSLKSESFSIHTQQITDKSTASTSNLDYPQYTQPRTLQYKGKLLKVPEVLISGNHQAIKQWRLEQSQQRST